MKSTLTEKQIKYVLQHYQDERYSDIGKAIGVNENTIGRWLNSHGYHKERRNSIFSKQQKQFIRLHYLNMTYREIGDKLGFTEKQIRGWVAANCKNKIKLYNKMYFQNIDTPNKAYWLGFIYADGWVRLIYFGSKVIKGEVGLELKDTDVGHLEKLRNQVGGEHKIVFKERDKIICDASYISHTRSATLRFYSKEMALDLISQNIIERKTDFPNYPIVKDSLFIDFLRGYIDGDGCISINKCTKNLVSVQITSSHQEVFKYIQLKVAQLYQLYPRIYKQKNRKYRLIFNRRDAETLLEKCYYDDGAVCLDRKKQKYLQTRPSLVVTQG